MRLVDVVTSVRQHWRVSLAILLLAVATVGIYLFTREETRPADRYRATATIALSGRDEEGELPEGLPISLTVGQSRRALSQETKDAALEAAGVPEDERRRVGFAFGRPGGDEEEESADETEGNRFLLSATADDPEVARSVAGAYATAYLDGRSQEVAEHAERRRSSARQRLETLYDRRTAIDQELQSRNPALLEQVTTTTSGEGQDQDDEGGAGLLTAPPGASIDVQLLLAERNALTREIRAAESSYATSSISSLLPQAFAEVVEIEPARDVTPPLSSPLLPVAAILGLGLLLAVAVPVAMDRIDHSIADVGTAAAAFEAPVLTTIPPLSRRQQHVLSSPGSPHDAAYRSLAATSIATDRLPRAIVVTSPNGELQDTVAANFAAALAAHGLRVALLATDTRQRWFLDAGDGDGDDSQLTWPELLERAHEGRINGAAPHLLASSGRDNLLVLPPGENGAEPNLNGLPPLLEALARGDVDVTVIAGPPLLRDPEATMFAWMTRSVLWVCEAGEVTEAEAREAASRLALAGATSFGVAMVGGD